MTEPQTNGIDRDLAKKYFDLDDGAVGELLDLQMEYMKECRKVRAQQKTNFKMAVAEGLPKEGFALELKLHRMRNKFAKQVANILEEEEEDTIETAEMVRAAIGEDLATLPLGRWALGERDDGDAPAASKPAKAGAVKADKAAAPGDKPKGQRGRPRKAPVAAVGDAAPGAPDALDSLTGDDPDVRPPFLRDAEKQRQDEAAERIGSMKELH